MATSNSSKTPKTATRRSRVTIKPGVEPRYIAVVNEEQEHTVTAWSLQEDKLEEFCLDVIGHYATSAPVVATWAEYLSMRLSETPEKVSAYELRQFSFLYADGCWMGAHIAANRAYKVRDMLGLDTTGMLGF